MYMLVCFVELLPRNSNELFIYVLALHGGKDDLQQFISEASSICVEVVLKTY